MRIPLPLLLILIALTVFIDYYLWRDVRDYTRRRGAKWVFIISTAICWIFLVVALSLPRRAEDADLSTVMWMLYIFLSVYIAKTGYILFSLAGRMSAFISKKRKKGKGLRIAGAVFGALLIGVMWEGVFYGRTQIVVNRVEVVSTRIPKSFNGFTIAQLSDIHVGTWGTDTTFVSHLVDSVNNLHPDMIVFTGDIVNRSTKELLPFVNTLSRLKAPAGVYSILGNHDYGDYMDWKTPSDRDNNNIELSILQHKMGWDLLNNGRRIVRWKGDSIVLAGVENIGDPPFPSYGNLEAALPSSKDSLYHQNDAHYKILLSHNPAHWDDYVSHKTNIDLTLSGHTHAMQMMLKIGGFEWSPAVFRYPLWGGMYERENEYGEKTRMYVNIGAGEVGMPSRLLSAYPEITLFTLRHGN